MHKTNVHIPYSDATDEAIEKLKAIGTVKTTEYTSGLLVQISYTNFTDLYRIGVISKHYNPNKQNVRLAYETT
ncbi:MAG TPA: hypothetical protein DCQ31_08420 [Bacteroidales bacterium]|nr:hypothetical protein [Bacteroidales bacterium]